MRSSHLLRVHDACARRAALPRALREADRGSRKWPLRPSAPSPASARSRINAITIGLIAVNVASSSSSSRAARTSFTNNWIFEHGALFASGVFTANGPVMGVAHGEWWRLVSARMFLHSGVFHLAVNMYSLYFAGTILEQLIGRWRFVLLYFVAGLAGVGGRARLRPNIPTVGASGAIFGILGALFILERRRHINTGGQIAGLIILNLVSRSRSRAQSRSAATWAG